MAQGFGPALSVSPKKLTDEQKKEVDEKADAFSATLGEGAQEGASSAGSPKRMLGSNKPAKEK